MSISTSTVFHFTNSFQNIVSILEYTFRPHFSLEDLNVVMPERASNPNLVFALPMVCFCDIPLSQVSPHLRRYGRYGIGLSKAWAIRSGLSPVLYAVRGSPLARTLYSIVEQLAKEPRDRVGNSPALDRFHQLSSYLKPYEAVPPLARNGKKRRFYDEREWRFVPELKGSRLRYGLAKDEYQDKRKRSIADAHLWDTFQLPFSPNDIRYIIVRREAEILQMIKMVRSIKGRFPEKQVQLLASRLITSSQVRDDF